MSFISWGWPQPRLHPASFLFLRKIYMHRRANIPGASDTTSPYHKRVVVSAFTCIQFHTWRVGARSRILSRLTRLHVLQSTRSNHRGELASPKTSTRRGSYNPEKNGESPDEFSKD